jgi:CrcB protein
MKLLVQYLAVAGGGAVGAVLRLVVAQVSGRCFGTSFPIGTLIINLSGSMFLGWFLTIISGRVIVSDTVRLAVGVGFVGAYTTFSTFMYESNSLLESGSGNKALLNLIGSVVLGMAAVWAGVRIGSR